LKTMSLNLCLLLIILAICCYEANATGVVCDAVTRETMTLILKHEKVLEMELKKYNAPPEAVEAKLKVKRCIDQITYTERFYLSLTL
ncbi:mCG1045490, partial [Mus musculus]